MMGQICDVGPNIKDINYDNNEYGIKYHKENLKFWVKQEEGPKETIESPPDFEPENGNIMSGLI